MSSKSSTGIFRQLRLRLIATAGATAALLLTWWWKVDDLRNPPELPAITFGQSVDMGRTRLTPLKLEWREVEGSPAQMVMTAMAENITGETQSAIFGIPPYPPQAVLAGVELPAPDIKLRRDDSYAQQLQPRLPEEIELIWTLPDGITPQEVEILFSKQIFKLRDNLYGQASWLGFTPATRMRAMPQVLP